MAQGKSPVSDFLRQEIESDAGQGGGLSARLERYETAKARALAISGYLTTLGDPLARRRSLEIRSCSAHLILRQYITIKAHRVKYAQTCKRALLCPMCAIWRGARYVRRYWERWRLLFQESPDLRLYHVVLTVRDGADLRERFQHLRSSLERYHDERKEACRGRRPRNSACCAAGAVWSYETKRGENSGIWHPHVHAVWACDSRLCPGWIAADWLRLTGDSYRVHCREICDMGGFLEVFKYSLKFSSMENEDLWSAYQILRGRRLVGSFGAFRGIEVPDGFAADDDIPADAPYIDLLFRWVGGRLGRYDCLGSAFGDVDASARAALGASGLDLADALSWHFPRNS